MTKPHLQAPLDWIAFVLLNGIVLVCSWTVIATDWTGYLDLIPLIAVLGAWTGAALGRSRFPAWLASVFAAFYGAFICGWQLGLTLDRALTWSSRIGLLFGRLGVFVSKIYLGEPNEDELIFVVLMAILFWIISVWSGWSVFRRFAAWPTILANGLTVVIVTYFYYGRAHLGIFLALFSLAGLLLAARLDISTRFLQWEHQKAGVPVDTIYQVSLTALIVSILIVALAWGGPAFAKSEALSLAWRTITRPFSAIEEKFENAFDVIQGSTRVIPSDYGETLSFTTGREPDNRLIMTADPLTIPSLGGRFYWRSRIYDQYQDNQWVGPKIETEEFDPREGQLNLGDYEGRELIEVSLAPTGAAIKLLYLPSQPVWVEWSSNIALIRQDDNSLDVLSMESNRYIREGESYRAIASLAVPSARQLRLAGDDYPEWVLERNLQLPDNITQRTIDLAQEITMGLETPFDKTVAITRWLRTNIQYERVIQAPLPESEPIDWFLFDYKIGFCNYYASAEVILLRSLGIPARLAAGYAHGEYKITEQVYEISGEDSHAWPEVFFPGIGWVEFEPTASQPVLVRPEESESDQPDLSREPSDPLNNEERPEDLSDITVGLVNPGERQFNPTIIRIVGLSIFSGALFFLILIRINPVFWAAMRLRLARVAGRLQLDLPPALEVHDWEWDTATGRMYAGWSAWLKRLGLSDGPWETPFERATRFAAALPESAELGWTLVNAYTRERFAEIIPNIVIVRRAWREMQLQLWQSWLRQLTARWWRKE